MASEVRDGVRVGTVIAGKFEVERVLGEGGMGYVVAARHLQLGQRVALKFIRPDALTPEYRKRFFREARNTVRLKSKHVSRVLDVGSLDDGAPYMVMEYLEGTDLSEHLQQGGPLEPAVACEYLIQACEGIAEAHAAGIVHRDLKPANLFLARGTGGEPVVKVLDFGVSKIVYSDADETTPGGRLESVVTQISDLLGSPSYIAPEQIASARNASSSSDMWSLGVILYRLVSGKLPFVGGSLAELVHAILHRPIPNVREVRPDLPVGLDKVIARCLERDPAKRPNATELARLLAPFAGPNVAPSLERIAILGSELVVADGPSPRSSRASRPYSLSSVPGERKMPGRLADVFFWGVLVGAFVGSVALVAWAAYEKRRTAAPVSGAQVVRVADATPSATPPSATPPSATPASATPASAFPSSAPPSPSASVTTSFVATPSKGASPSKVPAASKRR